MTCNRKLPITLKITSSLKFSEDEISKVMKNSGHTEAHLHIENLREQHRFGKCLETRTFPSEWTLLGRMKGVASIA